MDNEKQNLDKGFLLTFLFSLCVFWVCSNYFSCNKFSIVSSIGGWSEMPSFHKSTFRHQTSESKKAFSSSKRLHVLHGDCLMVNNAFRLAALCVHCGHYSGQWQSVQCLLEARKSVSKSYRPVVVRSTHSKVPLHSSSHQQEDRRTHSDPEVDVIKL